jgi:tRNA-Thr(GGU) m(6)t(6)A37 methyltransferase TsaA
MKQELNFIGVIRSPLKTLEDCPLQETENAPEATLVISKEYIEGIKDIRPEAEIVVLTWLDKADRNIIKCVSRNNYDGPVFGVFSTRSPDRPNPIGLHSATVISVSGNEIIVSGLEVLDQTPLIDIKPVLRRRLTT